MIVSQRTSGLKINGKLGDYIVSGGAIQKGDFVKWSAGSFTGVGDIGTPVVAPDNYQTIVMDDHNILCYGVDSSAGIYGYTVNISDAGVITYGAKTLLYSQSGIETVSGCLLEANKAFIVGTTMVNYTTPKTAKTISTGGTTYYCIVTLNNGTLNIAGTSTASVGAHDFKVCALSSTTALFVCQNYSDTYEMVYVGSSGTNVLSRTNRSIITSTGLFTVSGTTISKGAATQLRSDTGCITGSSSSALSNLDFSVATIGSNKAALVLRGWGCSHARTNNFLYVYALSVSGTTITVGTKCAIYEPSSYKAAKEEFSIVPDGTGGFSVACRYVDVVYSSEAYEYYQSTTPIYVSVVGFSVNGTTVSLKYTGVVVATSAVCPQQLVFDNTTLVFVFADNQIYLYPVTVESGIASVGTPVSLVTAGSEAFSVEYLEGLGVYVGYYTSSSDYGVLLDLSFSNLVYPYTEATTKHGIAFQDGNIGESIKVYTPIL